MNIYNIFRVSTLITSILILVNILLLYPPDYGIFPPEYAEEVNSTIEVDSKVYMILTTRFPPGIYSAPESDGISIIWGGNLSNISSFENQFFNIYIVAVEFEGDVLDYTLIREPIPLYLYSLAILTIIFISSIVGSVLYRRSVYHRI